ncbi:MAG: family 20 glycosylhydrolase [Lentisphaeria bacterium]|nr:family 20 glycosylhydrolase [Lentisphaeria bacterium]
MKSMDSCRIVLCFGLLLAAIAVAAGYENLLPSPSFESDGDGNGVADGWSLSVHDGAAGRAQTVPGGRNGGRCQQIVHENASSEWVRVSVDDIPARPLRTYVMRVWVRSTGRWSVVLYEFPKGRKDKYLTYSVGDGDDTDEWTCVTKMVTTREDCGTFKISLVTSGVGEAWFDDAVLYDPQTTPALRIPRLTVAPILDGKLDEDAWEKSVRVEEFSLLGGEGALPTAGMSARVGVHGETLYISWDCAEPRMNERLVGEEPNWAHDSVELFLGTAAECLHIGVTSGGGWMGERKRYGKGHALYRDWFSGATTGTRDPRSISPPACRAAVVRGESSWQAELAVPLAELNASENTEAWLLQLVRSRKVKDLEENSCWAYMNGVTFHDPAQYGQCAWARDADSRLEEIPAPRFKPPEVLTLVPAPQRVDGAGKRCRVVERVAEISLLGVSADSAAARSLAAVFSRLKVEPKLVAKGAAAAFVLDREWRPKGAELTDWQRQEAYELDTRSLPVKARAATERGLLLAVMTLRQLCHGAGDGVAHIQRVRVTDWPEMRWRGWHLLGPKTGAALVEAKKLVDTMAALKFNWIAIQIDSRLRYERDPDLSASEQSTTKDQLRELVAHAESYGMEVIPMTQCWSHFPYFLSKEKYRRFAEIPEPGPKKRRRFWNYCPRHPEVHEKLLFPIIEEQLECFPNAKYFHVGLDEITFEPIGVCPRCKGATGGELLAEEILRLHAFLKGKNLRMCMWGDQLLKEHNGKPPYNTAEALEKVPRDVVIFDWHYGAKKSFPSVSFFRKAGFDVMASGWYNPRNVEVFAREAHTEQVLGYGGTTWYDISRIRLEPRLMKGIVLAGEYTWSMGRDLADLPYDPAQYFRTLYDTPTAPVRSFVPIPLTGRANASLRSTEDRDSCLGSGAKNDLSSVPTGRQWLGGVPFDIPDSDAQCIVLAKEDESVKRFPRRVWQLPVDGAFDALAFLHTCTSPAKYARHIYDRRHENPGRIVTYIVHYKDGARVDIPMQWNRDMADWNNRTGSANSRVVWSGHTQEGARATLGLYMWTNPRPSMRIVGLDAISAEDSVRPILVGVTAVRTVQGTRP